MNLFKSTNNQVTNDFINLVNEGKVKISFGVTRRNVQSPYYGKVLINGINDDNYKVVSEFMKFMDLTDVLRKESKNNWKKLVYSNDLLMSFYSMDVFHQWITKTMSINSNLKTLVESLTVKQQESNLIDVCEDLPF
jgi:hypothetical protein